MIDKEILIISSRRQHLAFSLDAADLDNTVSQITGKQRSPCAMSGEVSTKPDGTCTGNEGCNRKPAFILVEPQLGENIGASMRAMANFGLHHLRLVRPRDGWPNATAIAAAASASVYLDQADLYDNTADAISDCALIYATTARPRCLTKRVLTPELAMQEIRAHQGQVAVLFGAERCGLANADIVLANTIVSVPVHPDCPALNLAQCVLLMAYEWRRCTTAHTVSTVELAPAISVSRFLKHLVEQLDAAGCFFAQHKRVAMTTTLENLFRRAPLTEHDVRTLWRVVRSLTGLRQR